MKPTLTLSPALRIAVGQLVSRLPSHVSVAAGVDPDAVEQPYFVDLRLSSAGLTRARQRITFVDEEQMFTALSVLEKQLGLPPAPAAPAVRQAGFSDLALELAVLGTTASIAG